MDEGRREERKYLKKVCREFHARVPWTTADHEEPVLREYDLSQPVPAQELSEEEEVRQRTRMKELDTRIRRWFTYRIRRLRKHRRTSVLDPTKDPYAVLLAKLSGLSAPPKARQAFQQMMHESYATRVAPVVAERWEQERGGESSNKAPKVGFASKVAREVFAALPKVERDEFGQKAKEESQEAKAAY
ncbi:hypothetical protein C8R43DRAFT_1142320, partial [Mycena crocata]